MIRDLTVDHGCGDGQSLIFSSALLTIAIKRFHPIHHLSEVNAL